MLWDGHASSWMGGRPDDSNPMLLRDFGVFEDPLAFWSSRGRRRSLRAMHRNIVAPLMDRALRSLRAEGTGARARRPS
jgi:hypothetical protein